jgi:hypothetical protein
MTEEARTITIGVEGEQLIVHLNQHADDRRQIWLTLAQSWKLLGEIKAAYEKADANRSARIGRENYNQYVRDEYDPNDCGGELK